MSGQPCYSAPPWPHLPYFVYICLSEITFLYLLWLTSHSLGNVQEVHNKGDLRLGVFAQLTQWFLPTLEDPGLIQNIDNDP